MTTHLHMTRRGFLSAASIAGGSMLLGWRPIGALAAGGKSNIRPPFSTFVEIFPDNSIKIITPAAELGQNIFTTLPAILADAMEADWTLVRVEHAPYDPNLGAKVGGSQNTGGSWSTRRWFPILSELGAAAKVMLTTAAANRWEVAPKTCKAEMSTVIHTPTGRAFTFGELAAEAGQLPVPETVEVKNLQHSKLLGKDMPRLDTPLKVNGEAIYGIDVQLDGMVYAAARMCPVFGGSVKSIDPTSVEGMPGVILATEVPGGVAVVAEHWWQARQALEKLAVTFDPGANGSVSNQTIDGILSAALDGPGLQDTGKRGDTLAALDKAAKRLSATYDAPFLAHAAMEPMTATVSVTADGVEAYIPTQSPNAEADYINEVTGVPRDKIKIYNTFHGGSFGRRGSDPNATRQAGFLSLKLGRPVKVLWDREQDIRWDQYRPIVKARMEAGLDEDGNLVAYKAVVAAQSILHSLYDDPLDWGFDDTAVGAIFNHPYTVENFQSEWAHVELPVPIGWWRAVDMSHNPFIAESFIDELAHLAGEDPYTFRMRHLGDDKREKAVLKLAAEKAGWGSPLPKGRARGLAVQGCYGSYCAQVAEVSVESGTIRVHRVTAAVDCGTALSPDTVKAQIMGGIIFGMSAALKGRIDIQSGAVQQSNFHDYEMLVMEETPEIEVHILNTGNALGGIGEVGNPCIAPAISNAVFALIGKRLRSLPLASV